MDNMTESDTSVQEEINRLMRERVDLLNKQIELRLDIDNEQIKLSSEIEKNLNENSKKIEEIKEKCVHKWKLSPREYHEPTIYRCEKCLYEK